MSNRSSPKRAQPAASSAASSQSSAEGVARKEIKTPLWTFTCTFRCTTPSAAQAAVVPAIKAALQAELDWAITQKPTDRMRPGADGPREMTVTYASVKDGEDAFFHLYPNGNDGTTNVFLFMDTLRDLLSTTGRNIQVSYPYAYVEAREKPEGRVPILTSDSAPSFGIVVAYVGLGGGSLEDVEHAIEDADMGFDMRCVSVCPATQAWNGQYADSEEVAAVRFSYSGQFGSLDDIHYLLAFLRGERNQKVVKSFVLRM